MPRCKGTGERLGVCCAAASTLSLALPLPLRLWPFAGVCGCSWRCIIFCLVRLAWVKRLSDEDKVDFLKTQMLFVENLKKQMQAKPWVVVLQLREHRFEGCSQSSLARSLSVCLSLSVSLSLSLCLSISPSLSLSLSLSLSKHHGSDRLY